MIKKNYAYLLLTCLPSLCTVDPSGLLSSLWNWSGFSVSCASVFAVSLKVWISLSYGKSITVKELFDYPIMLNRY